VGFFDADGFFPLLTPPTLPASRSQRERVGCGIPVSWARAVADHPAGPAIRRTIRAFTTSGYSISVLGLAPAVLLSRGGNYPDTGGLYVTNLPSRHFSAEEIAEIYRLRWEIELLFKELKTTCRLEQLPSSREEVVLTLLYATLLALLVTRAIARRADLRRANDGTPLSIRIVSSYLLQHARTLAEAILQGGRSYQRRLNRIADDVARTCRDPNPNRSSVRKRTMR
jgi:hypothetical protein